VSLCCRGCSFISLSTIYQSDNIVVMHQGEVIEHGTHQFLISDEAPVGKYRTMWEQQNLFATPTDVRVMG